MRRGELPGGDTVTGVAGGAAWFPGLRLRHAVECVDLATDAARVSAGGCWAVVGDFEGRVRAWRFADVERLPEDEARPVGAADGWRGPSRPWTSTLGRAEYVRGVERVRGHIREGDVYQVNLCRVLSAALPPDAGREPDAAALGARLAEGNPAPFAGGIHVPHGVAGPGGRAVAPAWVVSASPELFLRVDGDVITSGPIKGTAATPAGLTDKDRAENVMIADMVRNDLQRVCAPGTVEVTRLLALEHHPGLVHLVTTVQGRLTPAEPAVGGRQGASPAGGVDWARVLRATYPPASVSGAPKAAALGVIAELEPTPRGPYCGAFGWIDADRDRAEIAVAIRTFWWSADEGGHLRFGTGAGVTWGSDPGAEWDETELKARRLVSLAGGGGP